MDFFQKILEKKFLVVTGKGGTGKSLISSLLAKKIASHNKRVLIAESSQCEQISPIFAKSSVGHKETEIEKNISVINLNYNDCFREYIVQYLGMEKIFRTVFNHNLVRSFLSAVPSLGEVLTLGRLYYTCIGKSFADYDIVIFDAPSTGHFLSLLKTPKAIVDSGLKGPFIKDISKVNDFVRDSNITSFVFVTNPESLIISETKELIEEVYNSFVEVTPFIILNKTFGINFNSEFNDKNLTNTRSIIDYLSKKSLISSQNMNDFKNLVSKFDLESRVAYLPDLGVIKEPMNSHIIHYLLNWIK